MIGQLGSDDIGKQLRAGLNKAGVDTTSVGTVPGTSGVALITVAANGENSIVVAPGANTSSPPPSRSARSLHPQSRHRPSPA
jgi:ribokinase